MKGHEFELLKSMIESLSASTDAQLYLRGVQAAVAGRCSPYISHQIVNFSPAERDDCLYIENSRYALAVEHYQSEPGGPVEEALINSTGFRSSIVTEYVPTVLVERLLDEAERLFGRLPWGRDGLIRVSFAVPVVIDWTTVETEDSIRTIPVFEPLPEPIREPGFDGSPLPEISRLANEMFEVEDAS